MKAIILDTETTGIDPQVDRLVELAGVTLDGKEFSTLVNPGRDIPPEARAIHHIGPEDVRGAPQEYDAFSLMAAMLTPKVDETPDALVAHNAKFDRAFLERIVGNLPLGIPWVCTYRCAMMTWPEAPAFNNQTLRYWLGLDVNVPEGLFPHRALYDCIVTRAIFEKLLELHPLSRLVSWTENLILLPRVTFGKHKGKRWDEVDYGYLKWCLNNFADNPDVVHTAQHYLRRR